MGVDTNRTSLTGTGGTVRFGKIGGKSGKLGQVFLFETGLTARSPSLEINDIGFMLTANEINHFTWAALQFQNSFFFFRTARLNYNHWSRWDYSGQFLAQGFNVNSHATFQNNWQGSTGVNWNPYDISNNALRGSFSIRRPATLRLFFNMRSDNRKKFFVNLNISQVWGFENTLKVKDFGLSFTYQPVNALRIELGGNYSYNLRKQDQFVSNLTYQNSIKTIVGKVDQNTLRFTGRLSYNITPDLTLEYYGQPYITRPIYSNFAYVSKPLAKKYDDWFHIFTPEQINFLEGRYRIDENSDNTVDYSFSNPNFNFVQFRSNLVVRWEYKPGSEVFLVWSQGNTPDVASDLNSTLYNSLFNNVFANQSRNSFLIKVTYRFLK